MSAEKKVVTIKGEELPISRCRKFNKQWYKIGDLKIENSGDCYLIDNRYYREETEIVIYNHSIKEYILKHDNLIYGVVNIIDNIVIKGYFNNDKNYSTILLELGINYLLFDANVIANNRYYRECLSDGNFYHISRLVAKKLNEIKIPQQSYKNSLPYDSKGIIQKNLYNYNNNYSPEILPNIKRYAPLLKELSFGLEFETIKGFIPERLLEKYGLIPLRDGSISGIEYVTVPMDGEKGLQCSYDILNTLKERTEYDDKSCSLHLHLGNLPRTKEFILAFFKLGMFIQDEMYQMFPIYKKYNFGIKNKNYSAPLPTFEILSQLDTVIDSRNLDKNFDVLYKYLSMGESLQNHDNNLDNVKFHPADENGNHKWNIHTRYFLFNLIPLIFGNKQTIEFRIHTPTYDENKIIPFILMNSMLVNFVIKYQNIILSGDLNFKNLNLYEILANVISDSNIEGKTELKNMFLDYIQTRKSYCKRQTGSGDILGNESRIPSSNNIKWCSKILFKKPQSIKYRVNSDDVIHNEFFKAVKQELKELNINHIYTVTDNQQLFNLTSNNNAIYDSLSQK